jgi:hypothetical protein
VHKLTSFISVVCFLFSYVLPIQALTAAQAQRVQVAAASKPRRKEAVVNVEACHTVAVMCFRKVCDGGRCGVGTDDIRLISLAKSSLEPSCQEAVSEKSCPNLIAQEATLYRVNLAKGTKKLTDVIYDGNTQSSQFSSENEEFLKSGAMLINALGAVMGKKGEEDKDAVQGQTFEDNGIKAPTVDLSLLDGSRTPAIPSGGSLGTGVALRRGGAPTLGSPSDGGGLVYTAPAASAGSMAVDSAGGSAPPVLDSAEDREATAAAAAEAHAERVAHIDVSKIYTQSTQDCLAMISDIIGLPTSEEERDEDDWQSYEGIAATCADIYEQKISREQLLNRLYAWNMAAIMHNSKFLDKPLYNDLEDPLLGLKIGEGWLDLGKDGNGLNETYKKKLFDYLKARKKVLDEHKAGLGFTIGGIVFDIALTIATSGIATGAKAAITGVRVADSAADLSRAARAVAGVDKALDAVKVAKGVDAVSDTVHVVDVVRVADDFGDAITAIDKVVDTTGAIRAAQTADRVTTFATLVDKAEDLEKIAAQAARLASKADDALVSAAQAKKIAESAGDARKLLAAEDELRTAISAQTRAREVAERASAAARVAVTEAQTAGRGMGIVLGGGLRGLMSYAGRGLENWGKNIKTFPEKIKNLGKTIGNYRTYSRKNTIEQARNILEIAKGQSLSREKWGETAINAARDFLSKSTFPARKIERMAVSIGKEVAGDTGFFASLGRKLFVGDTVKGKILRAGGVFLGVGMFVNTLFAGDMGLSGDEALEYLASNLDIDISDAQARKNLAEVMAINQNEMSLFGEEARDIVTFIKLASEDEYRTSISQIEKLNKLAEAEFAAYAKNYGNAPSRININKGADLELYAQYAECVNEYIKPWWGDYFCWRWDAIQLDGFGKWHIYKFNKVMETISPDMESKCMDRVDATEMERNLFRQSLPEC